MYMVVVEATEERACALVTVASALEDTTWAGSLNLDFIASGLFEE